MINVTKDMKNLGFNHLFIVFVDACSLNHVSQFIVAVNQETVLDSWYSQNDSF